MAARLVTLTRAELHALLLRAARGAAVPLGHAEDLSMAVGHFGDGAAVAAAAQALEAGWERPDFTMDGGGGRLVFPCARAVSALPIAMDALHAGQNAVVLKDLDAPDLLASYLDHAAQNGRGSFIAQSDACGWILERGTRARLAPQGLRLSISARAMETLKKLSARTYVPATAASRAGAGAGQIDND